MQRLFLFLSDLIHPPVVEVALGGLVLVFEKFSHRDVSERVLDDMDGSDEVALQRQVLHAIANVSARDGRRSRGDTHDGVRSIHTIPKQTKGDGGPKVSDGSTRRVAAKNI